MLSPPQIASPYQPMIWPRRSGGREVDDPGRAGGVDQALAGAEEEAGDDEVGDPGRDEVERRGDRREGGAEQHRRPPAAGVGEAAGERPARRAR